MLIFKNQHFSVHGVEFDPDVKVSCQDPLKCQKSGVLSKWDRFYESSFLHSSFLHSSFHFVFEGLSYTLTGATFELSLSTYSFNILI